MRHRHESSPTVFPPGFSATMSVCCPMERDLIQCPDVVQSLLAVRYADRDS